MDSQNRNTIVIQFVVFLDPLLRLCDVTGIDLNAKAIQSIENICELTLYV